VAIVLLFTVGAKFAFTIQPFVNWLVGILFIVSIGALIVAIVPKARGISGLVLYVSSYVYGLAVWVFGLAVTLVFWGWIAVIIGLLLGGVGVVPIGMLAAVFNSEGDIFWTLLVGLVLTYGARLLGMILISSAESHPEHHQHSTVIDIEPEKRKRTWKDIE
jgi:hypothetical protein